MPKSSLTIHRFDTTLKRWVCKCRTCGIVWISRGESLPTRCPTKECGTAAWDEPYKRKGRKGK